MPIYDMYPYTNIHQMNLDEIIKEVEEFKTTLASIQSNIDLISDYLNAFTITDSQISMDRDTVIDGTLTVDQIIGDFHATADAADKLTVNGGSASDPVYFSGGLPVSTGATLNKSVTGNAGTADKLKDAFTLKLIGDVTGQISLDGSSNVNLVTTIVGTTPQTITTIPNDLTITGNLTLVGGDLFMDQGTTIYCDTLEGTAQEASNLTGLNATVAELNYCDGVTSNIQNQLDAKQDTISGAASTITSMNLIASRALISNANGKVVTSAVTSTELGYLDGVTSLIQTQLDAKQSTVLSGTTDPASGTGSVGDPYIKYSA